MWCIKNQLNTDSAYPVFQIHQNGYPADAFDTHCHGYMHTVFCWRVTLQEWHTATTNAT